jgi:hypothetical protein
MYRNPVSNGVRIALVTLKHHIPSVLNMDSSRVITYDGQPLTCYGCGEIDHQYQACTHKRHPRQQTVIAPTASWADITSGRTVSTPHGDDEVAPPLTTETELPNSPATSPTQPTLTDMTHSHTEDMATPNIIEISDNCKGKETKT